MSLPRDLAVLIVDDEPDLRSAVAFEFEMHGIAALNASDGCEALEIIKSQRVDLVVSDVRMPNCGGIALLDAIRKLKGGSLPVILMSGFADIAVWDAFDRGADGFFGKPFNGDLLIEHATRLTRARAEAWSDRTDDAGIELDVTVDGGFALGRGGVYLPTVQRDLRKNVVVDFKIRVGTGSLPIAGQGVVRWIRSTPVDELPAGCGIEFLFLEPEVRSRFVQQMQHSLPIVYIPRGPAPRRG